MLIASVLVASFCVFRDEIENLQIPYWDEYDYAWFWDLLIFGLVLITSFLVLFFVVIIARKNKLGLHDSAAFGSSVALKLTVLFTLVPYLLTDFDGFWGLSQTPIVYGSIIGLGAVWIGLEKGRPLPRRIFSLVLVAFATRIAASYLGESPLQMPFGEDAQFPDFMTELTTLNAESPFEAKQHSLEMQAFYSAKPTYILDSIKLYLSALVSVGISAIVGSIAGKLCSCYLTARAAASIKPITKSRLRSTLLLGSPLNAMNFVLGGSATCLFVGLFSAQNTAVFRNYKLSYLDYGDHLPLYGSSNFPNRLGTIWRSFDMAALASISQGLASTLPFLILGFCIIGIANQFRLIGILPMLAIGAFIGWLWSQSTTSLYATPYLDFHGAATLLGMIVAAAFGAGTNLFAVPSEPNNDEALDELVTEAK
jgi:hypothetical protein